MRAGSKRSISILKIRSDFSSEITITSIQNIQIFAFRFLHSTKFLIVPIYSQGGGFCHEIG